MRTKFHRNKNIAESLLFIKRDGKTSMKIIEVHQQTVMFKRVLAAYYHRLSNIPLRRTSRFSCSYSINRRQFILHEKGWPKICKSEYQRLTWIKTLDEDIVSSIIFNLYLDSALQMWKNKCSTMEISAESRTKIVTTSNTWEFLKKYSTCSLTVNLSKTEYLRVGGQT